MTPTRHETNWLHTLDHIAKQFSTCTRRQYAAIILNTHNRVIGFGYNGAPPGYPHCTDGGCPRANTNTPPGHHYTGTGWCTAQHAEAGALLHSDPTARPGGTLIVNGPPCWECARLIASSNLTRLVHYNDPTYTDWPNIHAYLNPTITIIGINR